MCYLVCVSCVDFFVVCFYGVFDILHAGIADFQGVSVEYSVQWVGFSKAGVNYSQKLFAYISFYICAIGRVIPCDFSTPVPFALLGLLVVFQFVVMSAVLECLLVCVCCFVEFLLVE